MLLTRQIWRRINEGGRITSVDLLAMQRRAHGAFQEMKCLEHCDDVLVVKRGPGSPEWLANPLVGEAGETLTKLIAIMIKGGQP